MKTDSGFEGRKLKIIGNHPHSGEHGEIVGYDATVVGTGFIVELESGERCFVFKPENIRWDKSNE